MYGYEHSDTSTIKECVEYKFKIHIPHTEYGVDIKVAMKNTDFCLKENEIYFAHLTDIYFNMK